METVNIVENRLESFHLRRNNFTFLVHNLLIVFTIVQLNNIGLKQNLTD